MSNEMKPCPFCGGEAVLRKNRYSSGYYVTCLSHDCGMIVATCQRDNEDEAIATWNRRANDERYKAERKDDEQIH